MPGSEYAAEYENWKLAFANGLSVFGYRHMTPEQTFGEVPESRLIVEWRCEQVRRAFYSHMRSRYQAFFGVATLEEAIAFRDAAREETGNTGAIWQVEADQIYHCGDMRLLTSKHCTEANLGLIGTESHWKEEPRFGNVS